jgi:hypothetical protein
MSFFDQNETKMRYPDSLPTEDFIRAVYRNLFDRVADEDGLKYWKEDIESGRIGRNVFLLAVINGALGDDRETMENKREVGLYFADSGISDLRLAQKVMVNVDSDSESVVEAKKLIDDLLSGREIVERGSDIHEDYFLFDINGTDRAYKTDGCIYPDENSTFDYTIYSDNSVEISYIDEDIRLRQNCTVISTLEKSELVDGGIEAFFVKDFTAYDSESEKYYLVEKFYNGTLVSIEENGTLAISIDKKGYYGKKRVLAVWKKEKMAYRALKALDENSEIVDYGYMREMDRNYLYDVEGDLYAYKGSGCIFPINSDARFYFEVYLDNTMQISFSEGGKEYSYRCALTKRFRKIFPKDMVADAFLIDGEIYYDPKREEYYQSTHISRGTIVEIYNDGASVKIKDVPGYIYDTYLAGAYKTDPLQHPGEVLPADGKNTIAEGYVRQKDRNFLYDFIYGEYAYKSDDECLFPEEPDTIIHYTIDSQENMEIEFDSSTGMVESRCKVGKKYKSVTFGENADLEASYIDDDIYYDENERLYIKSKYISNGSVQSVFANGKIAYVRDKRGYYYWAPVYAVYTEVTR